MERRQQDRCPVCQGPAVADADAPEGIRCRRSTCVHNHQDVACPRCGAKDLEHVNFTDAKYVYTCRDCTNTWSAPEKGT